MREGFFGGSKNIGKNPVDAMDDDMNLDEMTGQIEPQGKGFEDKMKRESKNVFEGLGFRVGDNVQLNISKNNSSIKRGKIAEFMYAYYPGVVFIAKVDGKGFSFAITPEDILDGRAKKI